MERKLGGGGVVKSYSEEGEGLSRGMARKGRDCEELWQGRGGTVKSYGKEGEGL